MALVRAAGGAGAEREGRHAVVLDEPLLGHHRRLGSQKIAAVLVEDVEAVRRARITAAEKVDVEHSSGGGALRVPSGLAASAVLIDQLAGPACGPVEGIRRGLAVRIVVDGDLIDAAVHRPGLDADDEPDGAVGEQRDVGGRRGWQHAVDRKRLEGLVGQRRGRAVHVIDPRHDRTVPVDRIAQIPARRRQDERRGSAEEGRLVRAGEDGPGDGEVRHREASGGAFAFLSLLTRGEDVVAVHETGDEPHQGVTARDLLEDGRGGGAVEIDADIAERDGGSDIDAHQDVTPGDNVVSGRERGDGEVVVALLVVFLEQTEFRLVRVGRGWRDQASEARPDGEQYGDGSNAGPHMPPLCCAIEMSRARDGDLRVPRSPVSARAA